MRTPMLSAIISSVGNAHPSSQLLNKNLLALFADSRNEEAFDALVRRYGSFVWSVVSRNTSDEHAAEDAFQATFFTLARVAGRLDSTRPLAGWLHTVAIRFAHKTRRFARRHRVGPVPVGQSPRTPLDDLTARELLAVLDSEIARLADRYRLPIILCGLQGLARDEAATQLGWQSGVLKGRLERGRELLRRRLAVRGLTLPAIFAGPVLFPALLSHELRAATVHAAVQFASGPVPGIAANLAERATSKVGWAIRWRIGMAVVASGLAVGLIMAGLGNSMPPPPPKPSPADVPAAITERPVSILPDGAIRQFGDQKFRHPGGISGSALSPDGKRLATAAFQSVILWDVATGDPIWRADAGSGGLWGQQPLLFSPDGTRLVLVRTNYACVWDTATGKQLTKIKDPRVTDEWVFSTFDATAAFTPDGKHLVLGRFDPKGKDARQRETTEYYDTVTWQLTRSHVGIAPAYFSPAGPTVIGFDVDRNIVYSDPAGNREIVRLKTQARASLLSLSSDGKTLAVLRPEGTIEFWTVPRGDLIRSVAVATPKDRIRSRGLFTPDGKTFLIPREDGIARLDIATGKEMAPIPQKFHKLGGDPPSPHVLPDQESLLVCADDGLVHRWNLTTGKEAPLPDGYANWSRAIVSPDGEKVVIAGQDGHVDVWDCANGKRILEIRESLKNATALAVSSDGKHLAIGRLGSSIEVRDLSSGKLRNTFHATTDRAEDQQFISAVLFAPDGKTLMASSWYSRMEVWDLTTGKPRWTGEAVEASAMSPDGNTLVSALVGPNVLLTDPATGDGRRRIKVPGGLNERMGGQIPSLAFAPDGKRLFMGTNDQRVRVCDPVTAEERSNFVTSEKRPTAFGPTATAATSMAVSPDSRWLATGGDDRTIRVWEISTRTEVRRFLGHDREVRYVGFGRGGKTVLSNGHDGAVFEWDLRPTTLAAVGASTWADLLADDPTVAYRTVWSMARDATAAVKVLRANLPAAVPMEAKRIKELIDRLGAERFADREAAAKELAALGGQAEPALKEAIAKGPSAESRERLNRLIETLKDEPKGEELRQSRAVQAMELTGGPEAIALLKEWASGAPGARLTEDAKAALARLSRE